MQRNIQSKHEGATALCTDTRHKIPNTQSQRNIQSKHEGVTTLCTDTRHKIPNTQCSEIFNRNTKEPRHCAPVRDIKSQILKWQRNIQSKHKGVTTLCTDTRHKIPNTQCSEIFN